MVHREAITHSQLDHPNILPFLGIFHEEEGSPPLTVLPFMTNGSLSELILDSEEALDASNFSRIVGDSFVKSNAHTHFLNG